MDTRSDLEIIAVILSGQIADYRFLISRYKNMANSIAYSILRNKEESKDAVQESFIKAYESLGSFAGRSKFSTWLFRIIYYTALTKYHNTKHQRSLVRIDELEDFDEHVSLNEGLGSLQQEERVKYLNEALDQLNPEDKLAVALYYVEGKSHSEISELTGWNLSATKVRIHRAKRKLEHYLDHILSHEKKSLL
jgi:RNA polymerase sigma factor (sigma-70 family)